jgi:hypothetical protein
MLGGGLGAVAFGYQKFRKDNASTSTAVAQEGANTKQFQALQDAITASQVFSQTLQREIIELRAVVQVMDRKVHVQQRQMTRMEMLLRQFSGLVQENGVTVPPHMQKELEDLIESDSDRNMQL